MPRRAVVLQRQDSDGVLLRDGGGFFCEECLPKDLVGPNDVVFSTHASDEDVCDVCGNRDWEGVSNEEIDRTRWFPIGISLFLLSVLLTVLQEECG